jgi:hypothetical protein
MGRPPKLVNGTMWAAPAAFKPKPHEWARLEKALGAKLASDQRDAITRLTSDPFAGYLSKVAAERASSKMIDAKDWLKEARITSGKMAKMFTSPPPPPPGKRDAIHKARANVYARLEQILKANGHGQLPFDEIFTLLPSAVEATIRDVGSLESKSRSGGDAWRDWVVAIQALFAEHGLPCGITNDVLVEKGFVHFVAAVQRLLPQAVREHMPKEEGGYPHAIAKAAHRAQTRDKLPENSQ